LKKNIQFLATVLLISILFFSCQNQGGNRPLPTETIVLNSEEDSEGQSNRAAWIESMHRTAPGVNWRDLEYQNQRVRAEKRLRAGHSFAARTGTPDTIANGAVIGVWQEKGSKNQAGSVFDVEYDVEADKIWLLSAGGTLWRGSRDGSLWEVVNQDYKFSHGTLKFLPTENGRRLIANIGDVPHYSDDEGVSWTAATGISINDGWGKVKLPQFVSDSSYYVISKPDYWADWRIFKTENKGESFSLINAYTGNDDGQQRLAICKPHGIKDLYLLVKSGNTMQFSQIDQDTGGANLLNTSTDFTATEQVRFVGATTETDTIFYSYNHQNEIFKTTDFGASWTLQGAMPDTPWDVGIFVSPTNPNFLITGGLNCFYSLDGGQDWQLVNEWYEYYDDVAGKLHADMMTFSGFTTADGENFTLVSNHGGLNISYDELSSVENISLEGLNVSQYYSVKSGDANPNYIIGGSQDQGLQRGLDEGNGVPVDFDQVISGDYGHIAFTNGGSSFWTVYPGGWVTYYQNTSSGGYSNEYDMGSNNSSIWLPPMKTTLRPSENSIYLAGGDITGEGGSHLITLTKEFNSQIMPTQNDYNFAEFSGGELSSVEVSPLNSDHIYTATNNGRFFYSTDGGATFEQTISFLTEGHYLYGQSIFASRLDSNTVWLAGSGYSNPGVYKSTDGGEFFSDFSEGLPATLVFEITANADESLLFAATEDGPHVYVVEEEKWFDMSGLCAPNQTYWSVQYIEELNLVRFGTYGRGIWDFVLENNPVSFVNEASQVASFKTYPNPATNFVTVEMTEAVEHLSLTNLSGRTVKNYSLSSLKTTLDVSDFPRGVYFLTGEWEGEVFSEKVILE